MKACLRLVHHSFGEIISNIGGMRVSPEDAMSFLRVNSGKQLFWNHGTNPGEVPPDGSTRDDSFLAYYGPANPAYPGYVRNVFGHAEICEIMTDFPGSTNWTP